MNELEMVRYKDQKHEKIPTAETAISRQQLLST